MDQVILKDLLKKYREGLATPAEVELLESWYLFEIAKYSKGADVDDVELAENLELANGLIWNSVVANTGIDTEPAQAKRKTLWPRIAGSRIAAAAAVLLIVGLSIFFYSRYTNTPRHLEGSAATRDLLANDIKPGSNKAYLILSNGKRLSLTDAANGSLAKEADVEITKADGEVVYTPRTSYSNALNTIETPKGGQYQVRLPDGSKVWLNAASKLIYPVTFNGRGQREVTLSGEAYFEIAKDRQHPFQVKSAGQVVTVLGTHFNINSYANEGSVKTTLLEGSVKVNDAVLKPGEQATMQANKIKITEVNPEYATAWRNGFFMFNNENLESVMHKISNWYNVQVIYKDQSVKQETFFGRISKFENVSKVLNMLQRTEVVSFQIEGETIIVNKRK